MKQTQVNYTKKKKKKQISLITQTQKSLTEVITPSAAFPDRHGLEERIFEVQKQRGNQKHLYFVRSINQKAKHQ